MRFGVLFVGYLAVLAAAPAGARTRIAVAGPMTGADAVFGKQMQDGATQAVADINASGGVLGDMLALEVGDDACDPRQAVSVANQLADRGVVFVDGHYCSDNSIPASRVYADEGVLQITPATTNPDFTDRGGWNTFRICGRDDQQGEVAGAFLAARFPGARIGIVQDNSAYGKGLADATRAALRHAGVTETYYGAYTPHERDYSALVTRLKASGIGVVYIGGYYAEAGQIARQAKEQGLGATMVGGDALITADYGQVAGPAADGTLVTFGADPRQSPAARAVVDALAAKHVDAEGYVLYSYAAVQVWAEAAAKAGTTDARKVAATLHQGGPWQSVLGPVAFDARGDRTDARYVFYVWRDGGFHPL